MLDIKRLSDKYIFYGLLLSLFLVFTVAPFLQEQGITSKLLNLLLVAALVFSVIVVSHSKVSFFIALALSLPMLFSNIGFSLQHEQTFSTLAASTAALFFSYVVVMLLKNIFISKRVDINLILSSICVYFLIAVVWALLYSLVNASIPNSFMLIANQVAVTEINNFMYYSIVTLTTLGYGDIAPISAPAKSLAAMEALIGQIYLTVLVARLVGMHLQQTYK